MNRKLFRLITLVLTVLLALAITAPALAYPPLNEHETFDLYYLALDCDGDEIWAHEESFMQARYLFDENGEQVENFAHITAHLHLYNIDHPELYLDGVSAVSNHSQKINGSWYTGSDFNFHAPGYPQLNHSSGYSYWEGDTVIYDHGRFIPGDIALFCDLLTPP